MKQIQGSGNRHEKLRFTGFYLRNVLANLVGLVTIATLNMFTPLEFFKIMRTLIFLEGHWKLFFLFFPFVLALGVLLHYRFQAPIQKVASSVVAGEEVPEDLLAKARQRLINLPIVVALMNLGLWICGPALVFSSFYLLKQVHPRTCLFAFFRTFMIGTIAAGLSFFLVEDYARKTLIPVLFPKGRLTAVPGTVRISILRRIKALYGAGTLNPMILLVGTLAFATWEIQGTQVPAENVLQEIFFFTLVLCVIFVTIAFKLNILVQKSIQNPIREMLGMLGTVRQGDFTQRMRVLSNDEIGVLCDAGNAMLAGLEERERIRDTFGKYVTPEIRDQILHGRIPLTGERREATLLFADLRGFTTYVEENAPEEVISSMRAYFTAMEAAIGEHSGLVLQYVGDEIEAVFGVPIAQDDHAERAIMAAVQMRKNLDALNRERAREGKRPFGHGIGIHTGQVLAGNTGSEERLSYALIGDTVNVASRIEQLTKTLECDILVSQETTKKLKGTFEMKEESPQVLKGYSRPVTVYKVL